MNIDFDKMGGLVPVIVQDNTTRQVLMLGYMNLEAYNKTIETGYVTFFSRSKQRLWTKGEQSGNFLKLVSIASDCDDDTILCKVNPVGPVCHTGTDTCWGEENKADINFLSYLQDFIGKVKVGDAEEPYVSELFKDGLNRMAQMVGEEAVDTVIKATNAPDEEFINEASDLIYHLLVLLSSKNKRIEDIALELKKRHNQLSE